MAFRQLTARERRSVGMARNLHRYTDAPPNAPIDPAHIFTRRTMIALAVMEREAPKELPMPTPPKTKRAYNRRQWPKAGYKIINGKRVYPPEHQNGAAAKAEEKPAKRYSEVRLDEGLPPTHKMNTPQIMQQPLIEEMPEVPLHSPEPSRFSDHEVLAASVQLLTRRLDEITTKFIEVLQRLETVEALPRVPPPSTNALVQAIRMRCIDHSFGADSDLNKFARSLVDQIDSFT